MYVCVYVQDTDCADDSTHVPRNRGSTDTQTHTDKGTSCSIKGKNYSMQYDKLLHVPVYANNSNEALHRWLPGSMLR